MLGFTNGVRAQDSKFAGEAKREETVSLKQGRLRASGYGTEQSESAQMY